MGTDESVTAQILTGVAVHERHLGRKPRGMWVPECGYRPAGPWQPALRRKRRTRPWTPFARIGVEEALAEAGIEYFFIDTHLIEESIQFTPYRWRPATSGCCCTTFPPMS